MKYKAKETYKNLTEKDNFISLGSASSHLLLMDNMQIEFNYKIPSKLKKHLIEVKGSK